MGYQFKTLPTQFVSTATYKGREFKVVLYRQGRDDTWALEVYLMEINTGLVDRMAPVEFGTDLTIRELEVEIQALMDFILPL